MALHTTCDGVRRRDFIKVGACGAAALTLPNYLQMAAAGQVSGSAKAKNAIFINLRGGPSHMDTFDLKPDAPKEFRGEFNPIKTNVPGVEFSEHLPKLAQQADKFAILRGVSHTLGAHGLGTEYVNTGTRPLASLEYPGYGAVFMKERQKALPGDLPGFVAVPNTAQTPGFLGVKYAPLVTGSAPRPGRPFNVRGVALGRGLTVSDVERRQNLLKNLDTAFHGFEEQSDLLGGLDQFGQKAHAMITGSRTREAFDISKESPKFAETFGESQFGMSCLLAARLVESGVGFVTISTGGWDTHGDNFTKLKTKLLPEFDTGLASLLNGLAMKGLLESTAIFVTGEFGRTPKINTRSTEGGRDHYPRCMFMLMAGGGIRGGQVVGESDDKATEPASRGFTPDDAAATFYAAMGIDHTKEYQTNTGRPITIVRNGSPIPELIG
ncbi:DUF1501 domain-containing protein [Stratiformator vulcanicus]|uniref:DUF1501 domain-containing protein n=1 Tax=Stratiformator vulcanicus TaxID=2527980 RepID=A0A517QZK3_9PLAN|nr:DUF1501 domain-containing protein [Stratiformator vulcanicus]QDT37077.1 hypothetical protein Pan189_14440 [Stratiformator vulcanicus]